MAPVGTVFHQIGACAPARRPPISAGLRCLRPRAVLTPRRRSHRSPAAGGRPHRRALAPSHVARSLLNGASPFEGRCARARPPPARLRPSPPSSPPPPSPPPPAAPPSSPPPPSSRHPAEPHMAPGGPPRVVGRWEHATGKWCFDLFSQNPVSKTGGESGLRSSPPPPHEAAHPLGLTPPSHHPRLP